MSDSTENTNELDSYGVWVKNTSEEETTDNEVNFTDSLDLPDFDETDSLEDSDFSDMFNEDDTLNLESSSDDTTLTDDELMNITSGDGIEIAETTDDSLNEENSDEQSSDDFNIDDNSLDDISFDSLEENSVSDADLDNFTTESEEPAADETNDDELSFDEVSIEEPAASIAEEEPVAEPVESEESSEAVDFDNEEGSSDSEEEISLDDFMDQGFSDESVASGNNGFAADAAKPASDSSEEVSLDDFVDMSEFGVTEDSPKKEDVIEDEKPLDMNISFDSSADNIQTEEVVSEDIADDDDFQEEATFEEQKNEEADETPAGTGDDIEAEEVDLSDFGIDADAEETPVTQDVEGAKNKETVVDYDLSVGDGNMNAAPVVNEIKSSVEDAEPVEEIIETAEPVTAADSGLLQQIVADLSNLKEEINTLKTSLSEIKASPAPQSEDSGFISEEIAVDDEIAEDDSKEDTGFFSGDDGDDTIALSTDELSNILNTADFSEETAETESETSEEIETEIVPEPETERESEPVVETESEPGSEIDETAFDSIDDHTKEIEYDFTDENLSEPNLDDIEIDEEVLDDDLPDEISIPKEDDILVESSSSDFMESVQDTTEEHAAEAQDNFSTVDNVFDEQPAQEEPAIDDTIIEEPVVEETVAEEPVFEEAPVEEPAMEANGFADIDIEEPMEPEADQETFVPDEEVTVEEPVVTEPAFIENDFVSHEDDNNNLTDSNIDYLTTEDTDKNSDSDDNAELKKDIKSVLLYMDQLLENLPEEKIVEFAKSEEFTTYKKLFSELGLS